MNNQKQTSTERVKAHQARNKERKQLLANKGLVEISLIVHKDQFFQIKNAAKMTQVSDAKLLYVVTQPAIKKLCKAHDQILIRRGEEQERLRQEWCDNNPELLKELLNSEV